MITETKPILPETEKPGSGFAHIPADPPEALIALCGFQGTKLFKEPLSSSPPLCAVCADLAGIGQFSHE